MDHFRPEIAKLLDASNSQNTWKTYNNGLTSFVSFRLEEGLGNTWPPSISHLVNYVAYLSKLGYAPATVKVYLSGLSYYLRINELTDLTSSFIIQKMLKGMDKLYGVVDSRKPITLEILARLINSLQFVCSSVYECTLFRSMFSLAFFAFLRIGEITINRNTQHVINNDDVNVSHHSQSAYITIPFSKTDQKGLSTTLTVESFNQVDICPVRLLLNFISIRHQNNGPLFCHFNKTGVTRYQFSSVLCKTMKFIDCNPNEYNTHSFRIGAATHFAMNGHTDEDIMTLGRWKSASFKRYIRIELTK